MCWRRLSCALPLSLFSLFSLFFHEIISERHLVFGRNPGTLTVMRLKKQREWSLFFAVSRCFSLFLVE
jgi:hypothetical protein